MNKIFVIDNDNFPFVIYTNQVEQNAIYFSLAGLVCVPLLNFMGIFFRFVDCAQELVLIIFLNTDLPLNLVELLTFTRNFHLSFIIPSFIIPDAKKLKNNKTLISDKYEIPYPQTKFISNNVSSSFIVNGFSMIFIFQIIPWLICFIIYIAKKILPKLKSHKMIKKMENLFFYNLIFYFFLSTSLEGCLFLTLQWRNPSFNNALNIFSFVFSILYFGYFIFMLFWLKKVLDDILYIEQNHPSFDYSSIPITFHGILNKHDPERKLSLYFHLINTIKKFCLCFAVVFFYSNVLVQILAMTTIFIGTLFYKRISSPMKNYYLNLKNEINDILSSTIYIFICIFSLSDQRKKEYMLLGQFCVYLLLVITLVNFCYMIAEIIVNSIKYICKLTPLSEKYKMIKQISKYFLKFRGIEMILEDHYIIDGVIHKNIMATDLKQNDARLSELIFFESDNQIENSLRKNKEEKEEIKENETKKNLDLSSRSLVKH